MFENLCSLPLHSDLFAQSLHPTAPLLAVGLSSGHVQAYQLPPPPPSADTSASVASYASEAKSEASGGCSKITTAWKTRRHKGSCRALGFGWDGQEVVSAGTDGLVKGAESRDGRVRWKIGIPPDAKSHQLDSPVLLHALTPQTLLLATDSSALHVYDLRTLQSSASSSTKPQATHHPHHDYISSLTPLPASKDSTSGLPKQWISTGGSTLALTDLRKGVVKRSEDQEMELLSSCFVTGLGAKGTSTGSKAIVGGGDGVLALFERGVWDDQDERVYVDRGAKSVGGGESLDAVVEVPESLNVGKMIAVGTGGGKVRFVKLGPNKVVDECVHDELEGVVALGFDVGGRMISGGGRVVKVWGEKDFEDEELEEEEEESTTNGTGKRGRSGSDSGDEDEDSEEEADSSEEEQPKQKRKKRKRNRGKELNGKASFFSFKGLD